MRRLISPFSAAVGFFVSASIVLAQAGPTTAPAPSAEATSSGPTVIEPNQAPAGVRNDEVPTPIPPYQMSVPLGHLFGDWGGARTELENLGITPDLNLETDMASNPSGGQREGITEASNLGLNFLADLNKMAGIPGASFLVQFSERWGDSLSKQYIGNLFDTQQVYGGESFRLVDAAYQQQLADDRIELRLGRISANDDFQVLQYDYFFMQNGFDGNPVGIYFNAPGMTAYPDATWGSLVKVRPTPRTYAMVGVYDGDPNQRGIDRHGWDLTMRGPVFVIGEAGLQVNGLPGDKGLTGDYKLGAWYDASTQAVFGSADTQRGSSGEYALFDQCVVLFGPRQTNRGLGLFGSATFSNNPAVGTMPFFFTAGAVARGIFDCQPTDEVGLGVLYGIFSDDLRYAEQQAQLVTPATVIQDYELAFELTYRIYLLSRSVYVQPDLQFINHPNGDEHTTDALVVGCRVGIDF
ncbi:MAG: carbohydrate porin [Tepidisphaeraceae bacterium]|jgi:porin